MRLNTLAKLPCCATVPASEAKQSPWRQLMRPAPQAASQPARQPVGIGGWPARDARVSARRGISTMFPPSAEMLCVNSLLMMLERQQRFITAGVLPPDLWPQCGGGKRIERAVQFDTNKILHHTALSDVYQLCTGGMQLNAFTQVLNLRCLSFHLLLFTLQHHQILDRNIVLFTQ